MKGQELPIIPEPIVIRMSVQSKNITKHIPDFDYSELANWFIEKKMVIGGGHIIEYLNKKANGTLKKPGYHKIESIEIVQEE